MPETVDPVTVIEAGTSPEQIVVLAVAAVGVPPETPFSIIVKVTVSLQPAGVVTITVTSSPSSIAPTALVKVACADAACAKVPSM